jgi:pilus assembly protein CpaC
MPVSMRILVVACLASTLSNLSQQALSQQLLTPSDFNGTSGLPTTQPVVPQASARPMFPPGQTTFAAGGNTEPTSNFIEPLSRSDAAIELIIGQGRMVTLKKPIAKENVTGVIAIGDPTMVDFEVLPNPRMVRLIGLRAGITDLTVVTADNEVISMEIHVLYDMELIRVQLSRMFPDCMLQVSQFRENIVLEGQARTNTQVAQIEQTLHAFISSMQPEKKVNANQTGANGNDPSANGRNRPPRSEGDNSDGEKAPDAAAVEMGNRSSTEVKYPAGQIINMLRVPGVQQVLLQVRVAELNRTGLREIGSDLLFGSTSGTSIGTNLTGSAVNSSATTGLAGLIGESSSAIGAKGTSFGIFPTGDVNVILRALRKNSLLAILAEPNLVALSGHEATFLAGGQFPVPVPQGGLSNVVTILFKDFGVQLRFVPHIIDESTVRLAVAPEVSTIDQSLGTTLVQGGIPVPGINTRRINTTVEMHEGETLALAGLLQVTIDAQTNRIPGLGDLPYIGPLFSNTSHQRIEKELLVLVTPFMIAPTPSGQELAFPGQELMDPNDKEFFFLNRIEGRTGRPFRSTTSWDNPLGLVERMKLDRNCMNGPVGLSR